MTSVFFQRVDALCRDRGISPNALAAGIGVSEATISDWKTKGSKPRNTTLAKLVEYFNVSADYLRGDTDDPIDYSNVDTSDFNQPVYKELLKQCRGNGKEAIKRYFEYETQLENDRANDPDRLAIYNHGENSWAIGNAHAPIKIVNGKEHPLSDQESELLRIFAELGTVEQSRVLVFAAELKEKK